MWIKEVQSELFTKIKYYGDKKYKSTYPKIVFTRKNESNTTNFPTVYVKFLQGRQIAKTLKGDKVSGFQCDIEIQITSSKSQDYIVANDIAYEIADILVSKFSFEITAFPIPLEQSGGDTHTYVLRASRYICFGDIV